MDYNASDVGFQTLIKNQHRLLDGCVPIYPGIGASASNNGNSSRIHLNRIAKMFSRLRLGFIWPKTTNNVMLGLGDAH